MTSFNSIRKPAFIFFIFVSLFTVGFLSFNYLASVAGPFTVAFILAYLLDPLVGYLEKKRIPREWGGLFVLLIGLILLSGALALLAPVVLSQAQELIRRLPDVYYRIAHFLGPMSKEYLGYNVFQELDKTVADLRHADGIMSYLTSFAKNIFSRAFELIRVVLSLLIVPLMAYYLLRSFPKLTNHVLHVIPKRNHQLTHVLLERLDRVFGGFFRGQLVVCSILATYYATALTILRIDLSLVLGLLAGLFNVIPYLGPTSIFSLTVLITLLQKGSLGYSVAVAAIFAIGQGAEGSFITPRIVGKKVGLSPLTLILALLIGGELFGLVGMLVSVPVAAISKVFLQVAMEYYRDSEFFKKS